MPVIGFLNSQSRQDWSHATTAFLQSLGNAGYVEGRNVVIEYRFANKRFDQLPALAADLVRARSPSSLRVAATRRPAPQRPQRTPFRSFLALEQLERMDVIGGARVVRGGGSALKGTKVPPKYRSPSGETWAGRGVKPKWMVEALKSGKKLDDFLIDKSTHRRKRRAKR
jgi:hypothetical protein